MFPHTGEEKNDELDLIVVKTMLKTIHPVITMFM